MPENVPLPIRRDAACPFSPDPEMARRRETDPVSTSQSLLPTGDLIDVRLVTGYGAAREALACPHLSSRPDARLRKLIGEQAGFLVAMDPPDHTRVRRLLAGEFTVRRINAFRPRFVELVDEALDRMEQARGPVDLMTAFRRPGDPRVWREQDSGFQIETRGGVGRWWCEVEDPVAESADDMSDVGRDGGQIVRIDHQQPGRPGAGGRINPARHEREEAAIDLSTDSDTALRSGPRDEPKSSCE
ncbi:hypothetical protein AB0B56_27845 [Streptosporangium canum]|uniref:hypothetical protein n=1 Tax=Streptosporangium canum TaxID=324952 RepID=UPI00344605D3